MKRLKKLFFLFYEILSLFAVKAAFDNERLYKPVHLTTQAEECDATKAALLFICRLHK